MVVHGLDPRWLRAGQGLVSAHAARLVLSESPIDGVEGLAFCARGREAFEDSIVIALGGKARAIRCNAARHVGDERWWIERRAGRVEDLDLR